MGYLVLGVNGMNHRSIDDGKRSVVARRVTGQRPVGANDVQPLREEEIDLLDVLLQRGVTCGVVVDIIRGAKTFAGVQRDIGRSDESSCGGRRGEVFGPGFLAGDGLALQSPVVSSSASAAEAPAEASCARGQ